MHLEKESRSVFLGKENLEELSCGDAGRKMLEIKAEVLKGL